MHDVPRCQSTELIAEDKYLGVNPGGSLPGASDGVEPHVEGDPPMSGGGHIFVSDESAATPARTCLH